MHLGDQCEGGEIYLEYNVFGEEGNRSIKCQEESLTGGKSRRKTCQEEKIRGKLVSQPTANIILAQSTLFTGLFFHCPSAVIITLFYYLREIHAKKCKISAIKIVKMAIFLL